MGSRTVLYACFIGDGYADVESPRDADDTAPEYAGYWYTPRHAEVDCPECGGLGYCEGPHAVRSPYPCRRCGGSGVAVGEPFSVTQYTFPSEDAADAAYRACEDAGDGYERAGVLARLTENGACVACDVLEWEPE